MQFNQINLVGWVGDLAGRVVLPVLEDSIWGRGWDLSFRTRGCSWEGSLLGEGPLSISEGYCHLCYIGVYLCLVDSCLVKNSRQNFRGYSEDSWVDCLHCSLY